MLLSSATCATALALFPSVLCQRPYMDWGRAYAEAEELISSWTIEQQANVTIRDGSAPGFEPYTLSDGPAGYSNGRGVSGWVTPQTLAASWDADLVAEQYARMAREFRNKGFEVLLGPSTGPSGRSAYGARLFENFGSDVWLSGRLFGAGVAAIQKQGVVSSGKHYLANEQGTNRTASTAEDRTSSNLDDRTLHEVYLWPWIDGIRAGMGSVMCVMNRVNGTIGCENDHLQNKILKEESGFKGFIVPDASAPVNRTAGLLHGLDWNTGLDLDSITELVENGTVSPNSIRENALRIVATNLNFNFPPSEYPDVDDMEVVNVREADSQDFIRHAGAQSIVLFKNEKNTLPLSNVTSIGVFGLDAANPITGPAMASNFRDYQGETFQGHLSTGGGSPAPNPYLVTPLDAITERAREGSGFGLRYIISDNYTVTPEGSSGPDFLSFLQPVSVSSYASETDHCLVFINAFTKEGHDRRELTNDVQDQLVNDVASYCDSTIVVMNNAGVRLVDAWIENPNVTAVLNAGTLGQESGHAIMDVLFGDVNPSAKLVYTVAKDADDYNGEICPCCQCDYTEGLYIDYRHFDQANIEPRFEFGFGLSYTTYSYEDPQVTKQPSHEPKFAAYATGKTVEGGPEDLFDELVTIEATVTNSGDMAGSEIAQLYLGFPEASMSPAKQLRGYQKVFLHCRESKSLSFTLQRRDLSVWDTVAQAWRIYEGEYKVYLGASSRDIVGETSFELVVSE